MNSMLQDFLFEPGPIVWIQRFFGLGHPLPFRVVDLLASTWGVLFVVALGLWVWGRDDAYALAGIVLLEALINLTLNQLVSVPRPTDPAIVKYEHVGLGSFPSGHVFTATALWGLLWVRSRVPFWTAALVVVGVAVGRLYLGVHYLADVVAGAALGALLVWLFHAFWSPLQLWLRARSCTFFVAVGLFGAAAALGGLYLIGARSRFMYNGAAMFAGGIVALLIEFRAVRFTPAEPAPARTIGKVGLGLLGIAPLVAADRITGESALWLGAGLAYVGAIWAFLVAPALFQRLGWDEQVPAPSGDGSGVAAGATIRESAGGGERLATWEGGEKPISGTEKATAWVLLGIAVAVNAAGYILHWWSELGWYDDVVHGYTIFSITLVLALYLYGASLTGAAGHGLLFVLTAAALGLAVGGLWEVAEWTYDLFVEGNAIKGKRDTILDLVWDSLGALAAGVVALVMARN